MSSAARKTSAIVLSLVIVGIFFYGSYLPYRKSQWFIKTLNAAGSARNLTELMNLFAVPLDMVSPIGQEELVRNMGGTLLDLVKSNGENAALTHATLTFLNGYYAPIISRGRGMSFEQNLFMLGSLNEVAYLKTKDPVYLAEAKRYLEWGRELGPKRPQYLYGLLDIYRLENDGGRAVALAQEILQLWPDDENLRHALVPIPPKQPRSEP